MKNFMTRTLMLISLLLSGAIFGFFYAWVCSTMWGLDSIDPRIAIQAMQAMNGSVRNAVFAPAFFATPVFLGVTAWVLWRQNYRKSAACFALGGGLYLCFGLVLTMVVNVPMNEALAAIEVPSDIEAARRIWDDYSPRWQFWNQTRTVLSGVSFLIAVGGVMVFSPNHVKQAD